MNRRPDVRGARIGCALLILSALAQLLIVWGLLR